MQSRNSATRAYRLDIELIEGLKKAAKRKGVSENSFVQDLLSQRVKADPLIRSFPYVVLSRRTLIPILGTTNPDGLQIAAFDLGKRNFALARELHESLGRVLVFFEYLTEVLDKQAHWFEVEGAENKPRRLTLRHECGTRWSLFLESYLMGAYQVVSHEKIKMAPNESYIGLELPWHKFFIVSRNSHLTFRFRLLDTIRVALLHAPSSDVVNCPSDGFNRNEKARVGVGV